MPGGAERGFFGKIGVRLAPPRAEAESALAAADALLLVRNYEESGQGWFWSTDAGGRLTYITDSVAQLMGRTSGALLGTPLVDLFLPVDSHGERQRTLPFLLTRQSRFDELPLRSAFEGDDRWWAISGCPQFDGGGKFAGYRGSGTDITAQRRSAEDASRLALYDSLTGLANRFHISKKLEATLAAFVQQQRSCATMLLDLDRFKQVNDTLGHPAGDALLKQVAERLLKIVGDREMVSRLGGDEFQIILPDIEDRGKLGDMAAEIIASLSQPYSVEEVLHKLRAIADIEFELEQDGSRIRPVDRPFLAADTTQIRRRFGWVPAFTIDDALRDLWRAPDLARALVEKYQ